MGTTARPEQLTSIRRLVGNTFWNLAGQVAPMAIALVAIPIIVKHIGIDRFGVLNLAWMAIGYFAVFDLGLGRALTKLVAEKLGREEHDQLAPLIWTASIMMLVLGVVASVLALILTPWLVTRILKIPAAIGTESLHTFYLLSLALPIIISTAGLRGVLEAYQRFDLATYVRVPMGVATFAGPLLVLPYSKSLFPIAIVLVVARLLTWIAHIALCLALVPTLKEGNRFDRRMVAPLMRFGGWMTVSNIISPIMVSVDRLVIGALVSVSAVSYYATPWEIVTKYLLVPAAIIGVLFPAFSTAFSSKGRSEDGTSAANHALRLYYTATKYLALVLIPIIVATIFLAEPGIKIWLGPDFAASSFRVMQVLAVGILFNGLAYLPFGLIQGIGRPDITAKLHLFESILYIPGLFILTTRYGIVGAAIAWSLRAALDSILLFATVPRLLPRGKVPDST